MSRRIRDEILMRIYEQNNAELKRNERAKSLLDSLLKELTIPHEANMGPLQVDSNAQDNVDLWNKHILAPYSNETWLSAPWLYAEFYFYRRIAEAFDFFGTGYDPFEVGDEYIIIQVNTLLFYPSSPRYGQNNCIVH